jgi:4-amino-4-deoxy-L-arabinose transferase-like glycosyltransferase
VIAAWRVAAAAGGAFVLLLAVTMMLRAPYPFELEWMEGATLEHVRRVLHGRPLYAKPSLEFVAFAYPPFYYYVAAGVARITGDGFLALRLVSIAATFGSLALIFTIVRREAGGMAGAVAAGLYAATYAASGAWMDLGRVDSLYMFFALLACALLVRAWTPRAFVQAGMCAAFALLTKQPIAISMAPIGVYLLVKRTWRFLWFVAAAVLVGAGVEWVLDFRSGGWLRYYVYELPRLRLAVSSQGSRLGLFWWSDMLRPLAPLFVVFVAAAVHLFRKPAPRLARETGRTRSGQAENKRRDGGRRRRCVLIAFGFIGASCLARLEGGAWANALMPAHAGVAILFGLAVSILGRNALLAPVAAILQFAMLAYDPRPLVPRAADIETGHAIVRRIAAIPGEVLVVDHGYLAAAAGKRSYAHGWAMTDVLWADPNYAGPDLDREVREAIASGRFSALVLDKDRHWFAADFERYYVHAEDLGGVGTFEPVSGSKRRPAAIYLRR